MNVNGVIEEMKEEMMFYLDEFKVFEDQIKSVQQIEFLMYEVVVVKKKFVWLWVFVISVKFKKVEEEFEGFQIRISRCQVRIDVVEEVVSKVREVM